MFSAPERTFLTPEDRADDFVRRWFKNESPEMREIGRKQIAALIRDALEAAAGDVRSAPRQASSTK
jgi:hypothetical protein